MEDGVINNTACRRREMHRRGVGKEEVHACLGISPSAHLTIRKDFFSLFVPQRASVWLSAVSGRDTLRKAFLNSGGGITL